MIIDNKFEFGAIVYLSTDHEQKKRMVTQICVTPSGLQYCLACGTYETWHYEQEINAEVDILIKTE